MRTVRQVCIDEGHNFPSAKGALESALYMDDFACSISDEDAATETAKEVIQLLKAAQFDLVKWSSNSEKVLKSIPETHRFSAIVAFDKTTSQRILGILWSPIEDKFMFRVVTPQWDYCTKRTLLYYVARFWDLMGFIGPVILYAKLLIKEVWLANCDWDDTPPACILKLWKEFCSELHLLNSIQIPRHVGIFQASVVNLVGFADASEKAYGAVVYFSVSNNNTNKMYLLCSKSRVSPSKTVSLARLELCAALLLSELLRLVYDTRTCNSRHTIKDIYAFSDSTVTLCWIHSSPHRWSTFVANRVSKIHSLCSPQYFRHISGSENPADCLSRGLTPAQIIDHPLWFNGPPWSELSPDKWPIRTFVPATISKPPEEKTNTLAVTGPSERPLLLEVAERTSSWSKLLRIVVYVYRFIKSLPHRKYITASDLDFAELRIICCLQRYYFKREISNLLSNKPCSTAFQRLQPFLKDGIIHVGGRLKYSNLSFGQKCFRLRPRSEHPEMSDHKAFQVTPSVKPFLHTGTDFAGPLKVTPTRGRGIRTQKAYICLFVCLTTKAVHIELASDLSTPCFLSALKRFLCRRGPVAHLYCDNGTNFVGAKRYLDEIHKFLSSSYHKTQFAEVLAENRINFHFNPPAAPHFGGSWEANIKSIKTHLFRVIGEQILTFEEMTTLLAQIESVLNSRPLCRTLSPDPSEPLALTPAHFLNFTPLKYLPAPDIKEDRLHLLQRHNLIDKLLQSFWTGWKAEYLHTLQTREKWNTTSHPVSVGSVVIVSNNTPPLQWPLGVIEEVFPAKDGIVRVAKVRTASGSYVRPVVRLCPLPNQ
nr:unnamed protein product [Callosobruchus analis]